MTAYYLAARYSMNAEMRGVSDVLTALGHTVTSRWIHCHPDVVGDFTSSFDVYALNEHTEDCAPLGQHDLDDIDAAQTLVSFSDKTGGGKGGRHVEFGYALAMRKNLVVVGYRENVFHTLPQVVQYPDWAHFVMSLSITPTQGEK